MGVPVVIEGEAIELDEDRRPYAPAANVVAVLERVRRINLPNVIDPDVLRIARVSEGAMGRVLYALRFLRLIEPNGRPTDRLRAIARAPEEEWRDLLSAVIREAYAADFARIDPAQDPQTQIVSAFKRYEPRSQTDRMVMLFLGLCRFAGMPVLDAPRERQLQRPVAVLRSVAGVKVGPRASDAKAQTRRTLAPVAFGGGLPTWGDTAPDLLFGVTVEDIGALPEDEFIKVWEALGVIARARARSARTKRETVATTELEDDPPAGQ